ncbi:MAG: 3-deoxy-manno-octulosonate cytidylyltransferase [Pedobacter sp.]|nr:MAG: 3-deoxy-manno-octulosonate cytidylyltransferase [Pedobacter sp.]
MKTLGIIPARFASTRFPGKPLIDLGGKTMIQRVYEQVAKAELDKIIIATDDMRIVAHAKSIGAEYCLTSELHQSGTDRCAEVSTQFPDFDLVINIQGDEPFIDPAQINLVKSALLKPNAQISTLVKKIDTNEELFNVNSPKVILNQNLEALYFSRQTIPYLRNIDKTNWLTSHVFYKHIGIYGFQKDILLALSKLQPHALELAENLEQLRWLAFGYSISTEITTLETMAIDSPEDVEKIKKVYPF